MLYKKTRSAICWASVVYMKRGTQRERWALSVCPEPTVGRGMWPFVGVSSRGSSPLWDLKRGTVIDQPARYLPSWWGEIVPLVNVARCRRSLEQAPQVQLLAWASLWPQPEHRPRLFSRISERHCSHRSTPSILSVMSSLTPLAFSAVVAEHILIFCIFCQP